MGRRKTLKEACLQSEVESLCTVRTEPKWGIITRTVNDTFPALKAGGRKVSTNLLSLFLVKVLVLKKMCQP